MAKHDSNADIKRQSRASSRPPKAKQVNKVTVKALPKSNRRK